MIRDQDQLFDQKPHGQLNKQGRNIIFENIFIL